MSKFKVGDRVVAYGVVWCKGFAVGNGTSFKIKGRISHLVYSSICLVGDDELVYSANPKQCRKLIKKPRKRVWVINAELNDQTINYSQAWNFPPGVLATEFIEVKKK